jgi:hypothetical protein
LKLSQAIFASSKVFLLANTTGNVSAWDANGSTDSVMANANFLTFFPP